MSPTPFSNLTEEDLLALPPFDMYTLLEVASPFQSKSATLLYLTHAEDSHHFGAKMGQLISTFLGFSSHHYTVNSHTDLDNILTQTKPTILIISCNFKNTFATWHTLLTHCDTLPSLLIMGGLSVTSQLLSHSIAPLYSGNLYYAKSAKHSLQLALELEKNAHAIPPLTPTRPPRPTAPSSSPMTSAIHPTLPMIPPDFEPHLIQAIDSQAQQHTDIATHTFPPLNELWDWINPKTLFSLHLGFPGPFETRLSAGDEKALIYNEAIQLTKQHLSKSNILTPKGAWQFFHFTSQNNTIHLEEKGITIPFPRQTTAPYLCLADYIHPQGDVIGLFSVTIGDITTVTNELLQQKKYLLALCVQAIAMQTAEALAEYVHYTMRLQLDSTEKRPSLDDVITESYRGKRYSFGYGACPDLSLQQRVMSLLPLEKIGVTIHPSGMMYPEGSVSGIVIHHPDCQYFQS